MKKSEPQIEPSYLSTEEIEIVKINQELINRMAGNSQKTKSFLILLVSALLVLAQNAQLKSFYLLPVVFFMLMLTLVFWIIDARYLKLEQQFRAHHKAIITKTIDKKTMWIMNPNSYKDLSTIKNMFSFSTMLYPALALPLVGYITLFIVSLFLYPIH